MKHPQLVSRRGTITLLVRGRRQPPPPCYHDLMPAFVQCDFIVGRRDTGVATNVPVTCDRWCCDKPTCSMKVGPNKHNCRPHYDSSQRASAERTATP